MDDPDRSTPSRGAARDRDPRLSAAILRINQSLDLATVLQEVVDSVRALTGARQSVITTIDGRGRVQDFVTSGVTEEERGELMRWPHGPRLFEHLRDMPEPLRVTDLGDYLGALGLPNPSTSKTLRGAPLHHRGEHLGHFFLGDKESGAAFTGEDEEILVLFASQAATAIANARTHREVERARADLEALVEISPVGVAVLDAATGRAVSLNREARRIVEGIRTPGSPAEQLLEVMTFRRADGRELSLETFPLARELKGAREIAHAEEIELSVPDGRSVRILVNATPIVSDEGEVMSVVVTMQDLGPLEELEKQRAAFLGMVSHELRAPLTSIKGSTATVLHTSPPPSRAEMHQFFRIIDGQADRMRRLIANLLDAGSIEAGSLTVAPEASNVAALVDEARTMFVTGGGRHPILIDLPPDLPRAMADPERVVQVLGNLLSNAARHAPPSAPIRIEAARTGAFVAISVSDEGRGIEPDQIPNIFRKRPGPGGGTGLGLAISKGLVEAHGGRIRAESAGADLGARFTFTIPIAAFAPPEPESPAHAERPHAHGRRRTPVVVVDDDPETLRYVRAVLSDAGYAPVGTADPRGLSRLIRAERPRLVLLDLMLPGTDGIELMKQVPELDGLPVIFISAYGRDETIARALEGGAADYIVKPFSPTELLARVGAALRNRAEPERFVLGDLAIEYGPRRVSLDGRVLRLTALDFDFIRVLSLNAGHVVPTALLLRQVWGSLNADNAGRVRAAVKRIRKKLGETADNPVYIFNEHSVGYRMPDQDEV